MVAGGMTLSELKQDASRHNESAKANAKPKEKAVVLLNE
jgi:hypothetical protein